MKKTLAITGSLTLVAASALIALTPAHATLPSCSAFFSADQGMPTGVMSCEVPTGITALKVDATGAGGGYGYGGSSRSSYGGNGGNVVTTIPVTPGETLTIEVGEAGGVTPITTRYRGGGGGGWTALFRGTTPLVIAGGGGGGGSVKDTSTSLRFDGGNGSTGGTDSGADGSPAPYVVSGSAVACSGYGGNAMTVGVQCEPAYLAGQTGTAGGAGTSYIGGDGIGFGAAAPTTGANRYHAGSISDMNFTPGSGGAGYYGGGGGGNSGAAGGGSGGGGSSYVDVSAGATSYGVGYNRGSREGNSMSAPGNGFIQLYSVAFAPTITGITAGDTTATVAFTDPSSNGGYNITNYQYSTDGGSNWTAVNPSSTSSPITITGLTNGTTYSVKIRAVNGIGAGIASSASNVTPAAPSLDPITPGSNPNLPASGVPLGDSVFLVDGVLQSATVSPNSGSNATGLNVTGTGFTMALKGLNGSGQPLGLTPEGALILEDDRTAYVEGTGFKPNSDVEVYLFSTPRVLGTVRTDSSGNFSGTVAVPRDIAAGNHTLQSNGYAPNGQVRSLNLGVKVNAMTALANTGSPADQVRFAGFAAAAVVLAGAVTVASTRRKGQAKR